MAMGKKAPTQKDRKENLIMFYCRTWLLHWNTNIFWQNSNWHIYSSKTYAGVCPRSLLKQIYQRFPKKYTTSVKRLDVSDGSPDYFSGTKIWNSATVDAKKPKVLCDRYKYLHSTKFTKCFWVNTKVGVGISRHKLFKYLTEYAQLLIKTH